MNKEKLIELLESGKTHEEIAIITGYSKSNVTYWINKYDINSYSKNINKIYYPDKYFFNKIDTREKAYILGFILGDGYITDKNIEITLSIKDKEILSFIKRNVGGSLIDNKSMNKKTKKYPNSRLNIFNNTLVKDIKKQSGGLLKKDRHIPIIPKHLERYLLLGFFDAEGCITWGRRKDRNRVWQKVSFTSQLKMLTGIQKILMNQIEVSSTIRPKSGSDCFVLEICSKDDVMKISKYLYPNDNFIILKRKFHKFQALRLELEEFGKI